MSSNVGTPAFREGFVQTNGHGRMHYLEAGSGTPLVLIHTNGGSAHQYAGVMPALARQFRVIAWDMPGHGDSDPVTRHYSIADYCAFWLARHASPRSHAGTSAVRPRT